MLWCHITQQILLNLCNQEWQIGPCEAQFGSRQAMVFDVGWDVLVMRMPNGK